MKHLLRKHPLCLLLGIIFCGVSGGAAIASNTVKLEAEDRANISQVIDEFFGERASIMVANDKASSVGACFSRRNLSEELKFRKCIDDFRGDLKKDGETCSSYRTSSEIESLQAKADSTASARVNESTFTTMAKNGVETGYSAHHDIVLKKLPNGKWQIVEDRQLEPTGLMPLYLAEEFVDASSPYKESESGTLDAGGSAEKEKPASTRNEDANPNENKSLSDSLGYSYQAMGAYLEKY